MRIVLLLESAVQLSTVSTATSSDLETSLVYPIKQTMAAGTSSISSPYTYSSSHSKTMDTLRADQREALMSSRENTPTFERLKHSWKNLLLNTWSMEIFAIAFSLVCLAAIFLVLSVFDHNLAPQLRFGLTLNTIISTLAAAAKSSLICAIAGSIGQLKWCWFNSRSRKLQHLQTFDDASRGPLGALNILSSFSWFNLVSLASLVTVLAVAFDPFVQQVLTYPVLYVDHGKQQAVAGKASVFHVPTQAFDEAISAAVWSPAHTFQLDPVCPSGNCTWPTFESLAWCSKCKDMSNAATTALKTCDVNGFIFDRSNSSLHCDLAFDGGDNLTFASGTKHVPHDSANGLTLSEFNYTYDAVWTLFQNRGWQYQHPEPLSNKSFLGVQSPFLALGRAKMVPDLTLHKAKLSVGIAEQCILSPCMRKYQIVTTDGVPSFNILSEDYGLVTKQRPPDWESNGRIPCWQSKPGNVAWEQVKFEWTNREYNAFCPTNSFSVPISSLLTTSGRVTQHRESPNSSETINESETAHYDRLQTLLQIERHNLTYVVGNIAAALTRLTIDSSNETVIGTAKVPRTYVRVQWAWLALPVALEAAGVVLLVLTIIQNRREKVPALWKSSLLPLLYHGLDERLIDDGIGPDIVVMDEKAEESEVRLATYPKTQRILLAAV